MSTDLEKDLAAALRFRADEVPATPCPSLDGARRVETVTSPRRWFVPVVAAAAAVAGLVAAGVALLPGTDGTTQSGVTAAAPTEVYYSRVISGRAGQQLTEVELWQGQDRADEWRQKAVGGRDIKDGRVVPDPAVRVDFREKGVCYPAEAATDESCTAPASWFNPTAEFLAGASRDPAVIAQQLHDEAVAEEQRRIHPGGDFDESDQTFSESNLAYLQLNYLKQALTGNGVPADLEVVLSRVIAVLPGVQTDPGAKNLVGERGTGYSLPNVKGDLLTVIFDADGHYIGSPTEAVVHGFAPALGEPPSRLID